MKKRFAAMALSSALVFCGICAFASDGFVVTPERSFVTEERYTEDIYYPVLGDSSFPIAKAVNDKITERMSDVRESLKNAIIETQEYYTEDMATGIYSYDSVYQYNMCGDLVSIKTSNYVYSGGAHGMSYLVAYTGNIGGKDTFALGDLFKEEQDGITSVKNIIKEKINAQKDMYFAEALTTVDSMDLSNSFYIDETGNLVIYFNPYEIAPYAAGIIEFSISPDELEDVLKTNIYSYLKSGESEKCLLRFNGAPFYTENSVLVSDEGTSLLPLREVSEKIGLDIQWSAENGVLVNGEKLSQKSGAVLVKDVYYVSADYFEAFKDYADVFTDNNGIVNIFSVETEE